jgi:hypothetical protein
VMPIITGISLSSLRAVSELIWITKVVLYWIIVYNGNMLISIIIVVVFISLAFKYKLLMLGIAGIILLAFACLYLPSF